MSNLLYILNPILLLLLCWLLWRQGALQSIKKHIIPALSLKLLAGILLGLLYHHYYREGDTLTFHKGSLILSDYAKENFSGYTKLILFNEFESISFRATVPFSRLPNFTNSFFFIKLLSLLNLLTNGQYYLNSIYLSLFSFWGASTLVAALVKYIPKYRYAAILAFLYFPSVVFWSSGVLKDAVLFGSICWLVAVTVQLTENRRLSIITCILLPVISYLFFKIKFFLALILLPLLALYFLVKLIGDKTDFLKPIWRQILAFVVSFSILILVGLYIATGHNNAFFFHNLVQTYEGILALSQNRPHFEFDSLEPTLTSMLFNAPYALFNAIYRPVIWETANLLYLLVSIENLLILIATLLAVASLFKNGIKSLSLLQVCFILMIITFGVIIGLATPNFGTLSRYRIVFIPFLVYLLLQNQYAQKLLAKLRL